jgi:F-type H+-transporting ATPase subunit a
MGLGLALFMFILVSNLLTLFPWFRPPTGSLTTTLALAVIVFFSIPYFAIRNAGIKGYLKKFIDPSPYMLPMNIFSEFASTFAMALRLFGNMLSGILFASVLTSFLPFFVPLSMQILGLLTGSIQAYIFALLAVVYTSSVLPEQAENVDLTKERK